MSEPLPLRVEPLSPSRRADYLRLFEHRRGPGPGDNAGASRCYCHFHHVSPHLDWPALDADANRVAMDARIACGEMEGYLAWRGDTAIGWLNAQARHKLPHCEARIGVAAPPLDVSLHEAAAIVCLVIAPCERGRGVARALLDAALDDLAARGLRLVDAWPRATPSPDAPAQEPWRGPRSLFDEAGFAEVARSGDIVVMRKRLHPGAMPHTIPAATSP